MTSLCLSESKKLKNLQNSLEKSHKTVLQSIVHMDPYLNDFIKKLHKERMQLTQTQEEILEVLDALSKVKYNINNVNNLDMKKLREEMICLQENISIVKQNTKSELQCLEEQEQVLSRDVKGFQEKLGEWSKPNIKVAKVIHEKNTNVNSSLSPEVARFEKFLKLKGCTCSWNISKHIIFEKCYKKYKDDDQISEYLQRNFLDLSINEIKSQYRWYTEYRQLKEEEKRSILSWRENSKMFKMESVTPKKPKILKKKVTAKADTNLKEKLEEWRKEKEERQMFNQNIKQMNEDKRKLNDILWQMENEKKKQMVNKWKLEKQVVSDVMERKRQEETQIKAHKANKNIKHFQKRDVSYIEKRRVRKRPASSEASLSSYGTVGPRDPDSLYKPTKQWISRTSRKGKQDKRFYCDIMQTDTIGIPTWRRETYA